MRLKRTFLDEKIASANARRAGADVSADDDVDGRPRRSLGRLVLGRAHGRGVVLAERDARGEPGAGPRHPAQGRPRRGDPLRRAVRAWERPRAALARGSDPPCSRSTPSGEPPPKLSQFFKHCTVAAPPPRPRKAAATFEGPKGPGRRPAAIPAAMAMPGARPRVKRSFLVADPGAAPPMPTPILAEAQRRDSPRCWRPSAKKTNEAVARRTRRRRRTRRASRRRRRASARPGGGGGGGGGRRAPTPAPTPRASALDPKDAREGETKAGVERRSSPPPRASASSRRAARLRAPPGPLASPGRRRLSCSCAAPSPSSISVGTTSSPGRFARFARGDGRPRRPPRGDAPPPRGRRPVRRVVRAVRRVRPGGASSTKHVEALPARRRPPRRVPARWCHQQAPEGRRRAAERWRRPSPRRSPDER